MKVSQIISAVDITNRYRQRIKACKNELNWELLSSGETEKAEVLRKEIKEQEEYFTYFDVFDVANIEDIKNYCMTDNVQVYTSDIFYYGKHSKNILKIIDEVL